jgi:ATP-dependent protease ClpP protease subunit|nr:MAG TPA: Putative ATP dependent Clp protease [Caudoviricetes sp.]
MPNRDFFRLRFSEPRMSTDGSEAEIMLYGEIINDMPEDWKYSKEDKSAADFDKAIKSVRDGGARKLLLRINSPGGILREAIAMRGILCAAGFESITIRVEGLCASAATVIASMPGANVQIMPGSSYMIHNPWTVAWGEAADFEHTAQRLRNDEATIRGFYAKKSGNTDEQIRAWMDGEKWFTAEEAVQNGFCNELLPEPDEGEDIVAACVTSRVMNAMKGLYRNVPSAITAEPVSSAKTVVAAVSAPEHTSNNEEDDEMDIKDVTIEQLRSENPALYNSIMQAGGEQERARMQEIDDLTPVGYEQMAAEAKQNGTSAMDFHKQIVKAQREKGQQFLAQRKVETEPANSVKGGSAEDATGKNPEQEIGNYAKEMAEYAKAARTGVDGGMY